jgi:L-ascorbate metabolism protein UlaG (beta-lactamase superfamily)
MQITWYGHAAFGIVGSSGKRIITDPYTPHGVGYDPIPDSADLVIISSDDDSAHCRGDLIDGNPEIVNALTVAQNGGSLDAQGLTISAIEAAEWDHHPEHEVPGQNGMYRFEIDGIKFAHMGDVGNPLSDDQARFFDGVDVLFALAGGYLTLELPDLMRMIHTAKPKLIIPMHFRTLTYRPRNTKWVESFLDGFKEEEISFACGCEIEITTDDLQDGTRVLVMDHMRSRTPRSAKDWA